MFPSIDLSLINTTENDEMQLSNNHVGRSFAFVMKTNVLFLPTVIIRILRR